jgi:carbamoyltransferase
MNRQTEPWVLGVNTSHHHGSMCLLKGSEIVVAIQEERLTRTKRDALRGFKPLSLNYCLDYAGITAADLNLAVGCGVTWQQRTAEWLKAILPEVPILTIPHHLGHAVGAFATSGFSEAAILVVDGAGNIISDLTIDSPHIAKRAVIPNSAAALEIASLYQGAGTKIQNLEKHFGDWFMQAPPEAMRPYGSLGGLYAAVAEVIFGCSTDMGDLAGRVMGLAPYGKPEIPCHEFFNIINGRFVFHQTVAKRFASFSREADGSSTHPVLAASVQAALEEALLYLVKHLKEMCPSNNLVFSGGVALNSVANERIVREGGFQNVYFMPVAEDSGNAVGAAYYGLWTLTQQNTTQPLKHDAFGKRYQPHEIDAAIASTPGVVVCPSDDVIDTVVTLLIEGKIIGWLQGRSELGPRALGQRSILCDPRRADGKDYLNRRVKHRESFRPFAPAVLLEEVNHWFELDDVNPECPFMLRVCRFRDDKSALVPAVVHVDQTGRLQTVTPTRNGRFYDLIQAFYQRTGVPILLNTSFNVAGEPIVESPEDALWCLLSTGVDYCILEDRIVTKADRYGSILDLRPYVTALSYQLKSASAQASTPVIVSFQVKNQWGEFESKGEVEWLKLLEQIDGIKTGWTLFQEFQRTHHRLDQPSFIQLLGLLRRRFIIGFR